MSVLQLPDWIEDHQGLLETACEANRGAMDPDSLAKLMARLSALQNRLRGDTDVLPVLTGLMDLLIEIPWTGDLVVELAGGSRLNPNKYPSMAKVSQMLEIVKNVFVRKLQPKTTEELGYDYLTERNRPNGTEDTGKSSHS